MGRLNDIEKIVNGTIIHASHVNIMPRGLQRFIDQLLRGTVRFGKRTGNNIAVINVDNTFPIGANTNARDSSVTLARSNQWLAPDSIVSMGPGKELQVVNDIIDLTVQFKGRLQSTYTTTDKILLVASPIVVFSPLSPNSTAVTVKSNYKLANGDTFCYLQTSGLIQSLTEVKVTTATVLGTSGDPNFPNLYYLQLAGPVVKFIDAGTVVYIRAYPAYFSSTVRVPNSVLSGQSMGPFLIDNLSARLLEGQAYKEVLSVKLQTQPGVYVLGDAFSYATIQKNFVVTNRPWHAHFPLFWDLAEGTTRITPSRILLRVNEAGLFCIGTKCVPKFPPGGSWRISVKASDDCNLRFIFSPDAPQDFTLLSGVTKNITVNAPIGQDAASIEINAYSASSICEISLSDWTPAVNTVDQISYSIVIEATGIAAYQSTGLMVKPYFLSSDFLGTNWDLEANFDSGKVYL